MFGFFKAKLIVFVSPDGGGKTTAISELRKLVMYNCKINERHIRFNNIPRIGQLLYRLKHPFDRKVVFVSSRSDINTIVHKHVYDKDVPLWKILIVLCYDVFDYLFGHLSLFSRSKNTIYIFDRYIYDYFTEKNWSNTPRWLIKTIMRLIPVPALIVVLQNDPEVIHKRKAELSVADIRYTQERIEALLSGSQNLMRISTLNSPEEIAKAVAYRAGLL